VATERRASDERRRQSDRRQTPGTRIDVTRLEHENLCRQIDSLLRAMQRVEQELQRQRGCIEALERDLTAVIGQLKKSA
jgi:hypothetical protein